MLYHETNRSINFRSINLSVSNLFLISLNPLSCINPNYYPSFHFRFLKLSFKGLSTRQMKTWKSSQIHDITHMAIVGLTPTLEERRLLAHGSKELNHHWGRKQTCIKTIKLTRIHEHVFQNLQKPLCLSPSMFVSMNVDDQNLGPRPLFIVKFCLFPKQS